MARAGSCTPDSRIFYYLTEVGTRLLSISWTMTLKARSNIRSTAARYVTWTSDVFSPARNFKNERLHVFVPFVPRIPSRSTESCIWQYNSYVRLRKEWRGNEEKGGTEKWVGSGCWTVTNLEDIFFNGELYVETSNYVQWANMDVYLYKCENTRRILSFFVRSRRGVVE